MQRDLQRAQRRLKLLQHKPQMRDSIIGVSDDGPLLAALAEEDAAERAEEEEAAARAGVSAGTVPPTSNESSRRPTLQPGAIKYASRRASAISQEIMQMMAEGQQQEGEGDRDGEEDAAAQSAIAPATEADLVDTSDIRYCTVGMA